MDKEAARPPKSGLYKNLTPALAPPEPKKSAARIRKGKGLSKRALKKNRARIRRAKMAEAEILFSGSKNSGRSHSGKFGLFAGLIGFFRK